MILIKSAEVYTPEYIGKKDVLLAGKKIIAIQDKIDVPEKIECDVIDATGYMNVSINKTRCEL